MKKKTENLHETFIFEEISKLKLSTLQQLTLGNSVTFTTLVWNQLHLKQRTECTQSTACVKLEHSPSHQVY